MESLPKAGVRNRQGNSPKRAARTARFNFPSVQKPKLFVD
jgi:hypothetical protein